MGSYIDVLYSTVGFFGRLGSNVFQDVGTPYRDEIVDLLRDILKVMAPEQIQQRWHKGVASVLYTYAIVSNQNICIYIYVYIYIYAWVGGAGAAAPPSWKIFENFDLKED